MLWLALVLGLVVTLFLRDRRSFAVVFVLLFVALGVQRLSGEMLLVVGVDFDGTEVIDQTESCGSAVGVLTGSGDAIGPNLAADCRKSANSRIVEALASFLVGIGGAIGGWYLIPHLSPTPMDEVLNPLPRRGDRGPLQEGTTGTRAERRRRSDT